MLSCKNAKEQAALKTLKRVTDVQTFVWTGELPELLSQVKIRTFHRPKGGLFLTWAHVLMNKCPDLLHSF